MEENKNWRLSWIMPIEKIIDADDIYDKEKLGLFFDPYIYNELKSFRSYGIEVNRLIIIDLLRN